MKKNETEDSVNNMIIEFLEEKIKSASTEEEARKIVESMKEAPFEDFLSEVYKELAKETAIFFESTMHEKVSDWETEDNEFISALDQLWGNAFVASKAMYIMVLESAEMYSKYVASLDRNETSNLMYTYGALRFIHARALQQFLEILTLIKNGFADGAYARWRSMYELVIIAHFINEHGEKVAKSYIESAITEDQYEWGREYEPLKKKKGRIMLKDIKDNSKFNSKIWDDQYTLANKIIHPSSQGTFSRLSYLGTPETVLVGPSNYGLSTPAEHSAISLAEITQLFYSLFANGEFLVTILYINEWLDVIRKIYFSIHDEHFPDDSPLLPKMESK